MGGITLPKKTPLQLVPVLVSSAIMRSHLASAKVQRSKPYKTHTQPAHFGAPATIDYLWSDGCLCAHSTCGIGAYTQRPQHTCTYTRGWRFPFSAFALLEFVHTSTIEWGYTNTEKEEKNSRPTCQTAWFRSFGIWPDFGCSTAWKFERPTPSPPHWLS